MKILLAVLLVCFASWLALTFLVAPFVWIFAGLLLLCGYSFWAVRNTRSRLFWIYFGAAVVALGIAGRLGEGLEQILMTHPGLTERLEALRQLES